MESYNVWRLSILGLCVWSVSMWLCSNGCTFYYLPWYSNHLSILARVWNPQSARTSMAFGWCITGFRLHKKDDTMVPSLVDSSWGSNSQPIRASWSQRTGEICRIHLWVKEMSRSWMLVPDDSMKMVNIKPNRQIAVDFLLQIHTVANTNERSEM